MAERSFARSLIRAAQPTDEEQLQARWRAWVGDRYGWSGEITADGRYVHTSHAHGLALVDAATGAPAGKLSLVLVAVGGLHVNAPCHVCKDFNPADWTIVSAEGKERSDP